MWCVATAHEGITDSASWSAVRHALQVSTGGGSSPLCAAEARAAQPILACMVCFLACNVAQSAAAYKPFHSLPCHWRHLYSHLSTPLPPPVGGGSWNVLQGYSG